MSNCRILGAIRERKFYDNRTKPPLLHCLFGKVQILIFRQTELGINGIRCSHRNECCRLCRNKAANRNVIDRKLPCHRCINNGIIKVFLRLAQKCSIRRSRSLIGVDLCLLGCNSLLGDRSTFKKLLITIEIQTCIVKCGFRLGKGCLCLQNGALILAGINAVKRLPRRYELSACNVFFYDIPGNLGPDIDFICPHELPRINMYERCILAQYIHRLNRCGAPSFRLLFATSCCQYSGH